MIVYTLPIFGPQVDTGANTLVTVKQEVFSDGMEASIAATDYATNTNTKARPDTFNNPALEGLDDPSQDAN
jgi:hypothetical protein